MNYPVAVFLFGGEGTGWALDADVETTRQSLLALPKLVRLTSLDEAEVVHSVWEFPLLHMDPALLHGKRIFCHLCNDLMRTYEDPCMIAAGETIGKWIANAKIARTELQRLGYRAAYIPYSVDTTVFTKTVAADREVLQERYDLPRDAFIISSFMRDSSGNDLEKPKEQKGVEAFVAIIAALQQRKRSIHILLAGPRRHWLRGQLDRLGVDYTFVGQRIEDDDNETNILSSKTINELYHASDLHLVTSRWEGGPRAVLECAATCTPILCTPVGIAPEVLEAQSLFSSVDEAVDKVEQLIAEGQTSYPLRQQYERVLSSHTPGANRDRFKALYNDIEAVPVFDKEQIRWQRKRIDCVPVKRTLGQRLKNALSSFRRPNTSAELTSIGLWHEYHKPPYGGGNQFMLALKKGLERRGVRVVINKINPSIDVYVCNSAWFDTKKFAEKSKQYPIRMIHRIDGPITLYRGQGSEEDDQIFALNKQFASATVFQSSFSFTQSCDLGYRPVSPVVIHNAVDGNIFHDRGRKSFDGTGKIALISTAWSDNPRKGGPFYKWLDENLDFDRFTYTFVGRVQQTFTNIHHIQPQDSEKLAELLRQHDIYITASLHEPCSNALLEALACGLPALYRNDGGNRELVQFGGLPFDGEDDFMAQLDRLAAQYTSFQSSVYLKNMDEISGRYLDLARKVFALYRFDQTRY